MIEDYSFGQMVIDGQEYTSDLIVYSDGTIQNNWHRAESHLLLASEIEKLIEEHPKIIVIGTGASGFMEIDDNLIKQLEQKGIEVYSAPTKKAANYYNEQVKNKKVGACFHLTC